MEWLEVIENPGLRDLPFKIELNEFGQIVMRALSNKRGVLISEIGVWFERQSVNGCAIANCSILTRNNVKVADVA